MTPEVRAQVQIWRDKALQGTLTPEECAEAINLMREARMNAAPKVKEPKAPKPPKEKAAGNDQSDNQPKLTFDDL